MAHDVRGMKQRNAVSPRARTRPQRVIALFFTLAIWRIGAISAALSSPAIGKEAVNQGENIATDHHEGRHLD